MRNLFSTLTWTLGVGLLAVAAPLVAETPDEQTAARESVCDPLKADGITEGLYELCVAFCESHDSTSTSTPITERESMISRDNAPSRLCLGFWTAIPADVGPPKNWQVYVTK